jgi:hypothetical protein
MVCICWLPLKINLPNEFIYLIFLNVISMGLSDTVV